MQDPLKEQVAWITGYGSGAGQPGAIELLKATAQQILAAHTRHRFVARPRGPTTNLENIYCRHLKTRVRAWCKHEDMGRVILFYLGGFETPSLTKPESTLNQFKSRPTYELQSIRTGAQTGSSHSSEKNWQFGVAKRLPPTR